MIEPLRRLPARHRIRLGVILILAMLTLALLGFSVRGEG
jgi:hypothetical protein